jgi:hypothetical protein
MVARVVQPRARRRSAPLLRDASGWPESRLNGMSPIRLLAAATLLTLGVALGAGRAGADEGLTLGGAAGAGPASAVVLAAGR